MAHRGKALYPKSSFNLVGQSLQQSAGRDDASDNDDANSGVGLHAASGGSSTVSVAWSSQPNSPKGFAIMDQVMAVNRSLVQQIEALRLRMQVDSRHHDATRSALERESDEKLRMKDTEIDDLKGELRKKEDTVKHLTDENQKKRTEIQSLQHTVNALKDDVEASKKYVDDIQKNLNILREEKEKLESGTAYKEKEDLIHRMTKEVSEMRANILKLERELSKAKEVISTQGSKLRLLDHEKHNMHIKFKDDLARATQTMRHEVEKMREVMRGQWEEMRVLRQQNEGMSTDIREIKDMLIGEAIAEPKGPVYNMGALKPSLPALSNNTRRNNIHGRKKPLG